MICKLAIALGAALLLSAATCEAMPSVPPTMFSGELRCRCVEYSKPFNPKLVKELRLIDQGPHCNVLEVIVTLVDKNEHCLNFSEEWVQRIVYSYMKRLERQQL